MKTTSNGTFITGVGAVEKSISQPNSIAFQDADGCVVHMDIAALDRLIAYRNTLPPTQTITQRPVGQPQSKLDTFFTTT